MNLINSIINIHELLKIALKRRQKENRRFHRRVKSTFTKYIFPAYLEFQSIHKFYIDRYTKYLSIVNKYDFVDNEEHPLFDLVRNDNINTDNELLNLYEVHENIYGKVKWLSHSDFTDLLHGINSYFFAAYFAGELYYELMEDELISLFYPVNKNIYSKEFSFMFDENFNSLITNDLKGILNDESPIGDKKKYAVITLENLITKLEDRYTKISLSYKELEVFYLDFDYKSW